MPSPTALQYIQQLILQIERDLLRYAGLRALADEARVTLAMGRRELRSAKARLIRQRKVCPTPFERRA